MPQEKQLAFVGGGNMGEALLRGLLAGKLFRPEDVMVSDVREDRLAFLRETYGVRTDTSNAKVVRPADIVLLAVKPQVMSRALDDLVDTLQEEKLVISIAARGGMKDEIYPMNTENSRDSANFAGKSGNDIYEFVAPVRKFNPNPYGLFDMAGNVWEWVNDFFGPYTAAAVADPKGPAGGKEHAIRGGSFDSNPKEHLRISYREGKSKDANNIGFRCAIDNTPESQKLLPNPEPGR